jgi:uncharacterized membrane protein YidH (DUF202 family)
MNRTEQVKRNPTATYVGIALCVVGFALIAIAWNGAAELDFIQGQFPYLISGGLTGISLIIVGVTVMVIETIRRDAELRTIQIERLTASLAVLTKEMSPPDPFDPSVAGEFKPRPRAVAQGNGRSDDTMELTAAGDGTWESGS